MKITALSIRKKLEEVLDPELNISIVDLGLVYNVKVEKANKVTILMTLTTIGCPLISMIETDIKTKLSDLGLKDNSVIIDLTFDPPWSMDKMSEKAKAMLGIT